MPNLESEAAALDNIQRLVAEEHKLFEDPSRTDEQEQRLKAVQVQLDQCWDLLRQRRALNETGGNPEDAHLRPPETVERYVG